MHKKIQNEVKTHVNGIEVRKANGEVFNFQENTILKLVVGVLNLKRWNDLKILFCCKSNEHFASKLLDIAQEYLIANGINGTKNACDKTQQKTNTTVEKPTKQQQQNVEDIPNENHQTVDSMLQEAPKDVKLENQQDVINPELSEESKTKEKEEKSTKKKKTTSPVKKDKSKEFDVRRAPQLEIQSDNSKENGEKSPENLAAIRIKHCQNCSTRHIEDHCPINYPHFVVADSVNVESWNEKYKKIHEVETNKTIKAEKDEEVDRNKFALARVSLPNLFKFVDTNSNHGLGVVCNSQIQLFTQFGPLIGKTIKEVDIQEDSGMKDIWEISLESGNIYISTEDLEESNWMRYVRPAPTRNEKNLTVICKENKIYFVSVKFINEGEELLYWQDSPLSNTKKKLEKTICGGCNMTFAHPLYYRTHCSVFHDVRYSLTIRKYHCKVCGAAVLGKENIMKHAAELHNGQGAYQCQFCKKFFLRLNYLEMHRTYGCSANPHRARPLCDFCGRKFCQPQKLKVHIKRMHSGLEILKEFQCKNCMKILGSRAALQRHMKEVHQKQGDGTCSCIRCGKPFQNKSNLKIHMLTHSGIKPFRCAEDGCNAAFTTKQCLQFHYKKVHNYAEDNMPKIERSVNYTFQAYSGLEGERDKNNDQNDYENGEREEEIIEQNDEECYMDDGSLDSKSMDDPPAIQSPLILPEEQSPPPPPQPPDPPTSPSPSIDVYVSQMSTSSTMKVVSKGSKKWIADDPPLQSLKASDFYSIERLSKDDLNGIQEHDLYDRKLSNMTDFTRHEPSNASLLVEAALDSVCSEPNIDIDVSSAPNCTDTLVNNLYTLTQPDNLTEVNYGLDESRDISLMSPSVNDHISVTDELGDELQQNQNIGLDYSSFHQEGFSPATSPSNIQRTNFVKNYINSLSPKQNNYENKNVSPVPSPPRYDFGHGANTEHLSSDESNGMAAQNLSLHGTKNDIQLDLSIYKPGYKIDYLRRLKFEGEGVVNGSATTTLETEVDIGQNLTGLQENDERLKYHDELSAEIRSKFELDLDMRLKNYESIDAEILRQRSTTYENVTSGVDLEFRNKNYDIVDSVIENRTTVETDFRTDRNFEPLVLNSSELQGLDMSARSFHNYSNINRYHHLYPEVDRVDLRLNYSPPPPPYDLMRVVSLDLTPPGRHSVDLSLRSHPLHQIANTRLLTEHTLQSNHRLLDQTRLLTSDLSNSRLGESRLLSETGGRILSDHTTNRILGNNDHLLATDQSRLLTEDTRLLGDQTRLLEQRPLIGATPSGTVSPPVAPFPGYSNVSQNPYHPTPLAPRPHVTSPTPTAYHHYSTYY